MLHLYFKNPSLFKEALTLGKGKHKAHYERLEFLGDRVLGLVIADMLYTTFPKEPEGDLATRFTGLVRMETLAKMALKWGLDKLLITQEEKLRSNESVLSDVCEAVLGAYYLDAGFDAVKKLIAANWEKLLKSNYPPVKDVKSALQEYCQKHFGAPPTYTLLSKTGPDHEPIFEYSLTVENFGTIQGTGKTKQHAEQECAQQMLDIIKGKKKK